MKKKRILIAGASVLLLVGIAGYLVWPLKMYNVSPTPHPDVPGITRSPVGVTAMPAVDTDAISLPKIQALLRDSHISRHTKDLIRTRPSDVLESLRAYEAMRYDGIIPSKPIPISWRDLFPPEPEMQMSLDVENNTPQDIFGKVVDQDGNPIVDVNVLGTIQLIRGFEDADYEEHRTKTDMDGRFEFTGIRGWRFYIGLQKSGYTVGTHGEGNPGAGVHKASDPNKRLIYTMWKSRGAEPLVYSKCDSRIPYDGTSVRFNVFKGTKGGSGDLRIIMTRAPLQIRRGTDRFDWQVEFEVVNGGIMEATGPFPYMAPEGGYVASVAYRQVKDDPNWAHELIRNFYIRTSKGIYGRVKIDLTADSERPDTGISIEAWLNPASRNLEFDPKKAIKRSGTEEDDDDDDDDDE